MRGRRLVKKVLLLILAGIIFAVPAVAQPGRPGGPGGFGRPAGGMGMHGARPPMMRPGSGMPHRPPMNRPPVGSVTRPPMGSVNRPPVGPPPGIAHRPPMHPLPPRPVYHRPLRPIVYTSPLYYPVGYYSSYMYYPAAYIPGNGIGAVVVQESSPYAAINTTANVINTAANVAAAIRLLTW